MYYSVPPLNNTFVVCASKIVDVDIFYVEFLNLLNFDLAEKIYVS